MVNATECFVTTNDNTILDGKKFPIHLNFESTQKSQRKKRQIRWTKQSEESSLDGRHRKICLLRGNHETDSNRIMKLTRRNGDSSHEKNSNFECYNKTWSWPVHVDIDAQLEACPPSVSVEVAMLLISTDEFEINNNGERKAEPSPVPKVSNLINTDPRRSGCSNKTVPPCGLGGDAYH